ncbi:MAG: TMEM175 family protein [Amaricoccus sp.]
MAERDDPPRGSYRREGEGLEFDRVSFFTDAVYAIAMTLLVVELHVPHIVGTVGDDGTLLDALREQSDAIFGFFLGFVILGRYWLAAHQFFGTLRSVDTRLIAINLLYLSFVAFSPFPVALISEYGGDRTAFYVFAATMGGISLLEVALFRYAEHHGHLRERLSPEALRFGTIASTAPVLIVLLSLPLALVSTSLALLSWLLMFPVGYWIGAHPPENIPDSWRP